MIDYTELLNTEDIYEDDNLILVKSLFKDYGIKVVNTDIGIKNDAGDIVSYFTVDAEIINDNNK